VKAEKEFCKRSSNIKEIKMLTSPETVSLKEVPNEGLIALMNKTVTLYCAGFIYSGKLVGVNDTCVKLDPALLVYNTGAHNTKTWETAEKFPRPWYVQTSAIESFGEFK
jgi:hypothetical protein